MDLLASWRIHLEARNLSPRTIQSYLEAVGQLEEYLGKPAQEATRREVEAFLAQVVTRHSPSTAGNRFRSLQQFYRWARAEDEIEADPMAGMRPPRVAIQPPPVLTSRDLAALEGVAKGKGFDDRRDAAILAVMIDTGVRLAECAGLRVEDLDLQRGWLTVLGKGGRLRVVPFGRSATQVLDRYVRARSRHSQAWQPWLWLGQRGRLTTWGISQMVRRRGLEVGIEGLHPHQFRHTWAHRLMDDGVQETDLLQLGGWRTREMLSRYGASAASERAIRNYRPHSPLDRLRED